MNRIIITTIVLFLCLGLKAQTSGDWFGDMLLNVEKSNGVAMKLKPIWNSLRTTYRNHNDLLEMSWEERDKIWNNITSKNLYDSLGVNYLNGYKTSCRERGVKAEKVGKRFDTYEKIRAIREKYINSRQQEYVILTPQSGDAPKINGASIYGARPGHEIIYKMAVSGIRPLSYSIKGLPDGCIFDEKRGIIRGNIAKPGDYKMIMEASNAKGKDSKTLTLRIGDGISLTPPMGWNSWNCFACDVTAQSIIDAANSMVSTGLSDYGWSFINIDDCWMKMPARSDTTLSVGDSRAYYDKRNKQRQGNRIRFDEEEVKGNIRSIKGQIFANKDFEPMSRLTSYIHSLGLKAGIYISPGPLTCQCYTGSYGYEDIDAAQFAEWGFDYLKYDWCGYEKIVKEKSLDVLQKPYFLMRDALRKTNRDIVYSICQYGMGDVWKWGAEANGNCWRTTYDIRDTWASVSKLGRAQAGLEKYAGPGRWNDPDMLVVGYVGWNKNLRPTYLSPNEQYSHISLWCLLSSPLLIGADLTHLDDFTMNLLTNHEVLALNQDELGNQASLVIEENEIQVWSKKLSDGSTAVGIFNVGDKPKTYKLDFAKIGLKGNYIVRDLWKQKDIETKTSKIRANINRHGVLLVKLHN